MLILINSITQLGLFVTIVVQGSSNNSVNDLELMGIVLAAVHVVEYFTLSCSFLRFHIIYKQQKKAGKLPSNIGAASSYLTMISILFVVLFIYPVVLLIPPTLYKAWSEHSLNSTQQSVSHTFTGTEFLTHIFNGIIRAAMIFITLLVRGAWLSAEKSSTSCSTNELMRVYEQTGNLVLSLQGIFQQWFVLQWIIYFINITQGYKIIFNIIEQNQLKLLIEVITNLIYNVSAFAIPYACGIAMNYYHDKYCKTLQEEQKQLLFENLNENVRTKKDVLKWILENPNNRFTPSLCGLVIPLNNAGHTLTITLSLLAPILNFINSQ